MPGKERWLARALVEGAIAGIVAPIIVLIIAASMSGFLQDQFRAPSCADPKGLHLVRPTGVKASTPTYQDGEGAYPAENAMDANNGTAWVEGAAGYGLGEWIEFQLPEGTDLQMLCVVNGYAKSVELYQKNGRVRQFAVSTDSDEKDAVLADLPTDMIATFQTLDPPHGRTSTVRLTIRATSTTMGDESFEDTSLSEVEFWVN